MSKNFYYGFWGLFFTVIYSRLISAQTNFSLGSSSESFDCSKAGNLICLGDATLYIEDPNAAVSYPGSLSLITEKDNKSSVGIAYYSKPVRMLDPSTQRSASFNISFSFNEDQRVAEITNNGTRIVLAPGDGPAFLISADNSTIEDHNDLSENSFGVFNSFGTTSVKSVVVVAFSTWGNISLYFMNNTPVVTESWGPGNIGDSPNSPVYAWVEYAAETHQLEVRLNTNTLRPISPIVNYTLDLLDIVDQYMWVGFSGSSRVDGSGLLRASHYYIRDWTFESWGIPTADSSPSLSPAPSSPSPAPSSPSPAPSSPSPAPRSKVGVIVATAVGVPVAIGILAMIGIFVLYIKRGGARTVTGSRRDSSRRADLSMQSVEMPEEYRFRYKHLSLATGGFSDAAKLGHGGFGNVYRGVLPTSGIPVAVKKINREASQGEREFKAEVTIISQLRHRNLIQLLGWCDDKGNYLIVYELMSNGSLDKLLFGLDESHTVLSWAQRFNIITGVAAALDYLHQGWKQQVIHRDIKASNIMLDDNWNAILGDFGLARLVDHQTTAATTLVAGTYGYIAPEVAFSGKFTDKTDVFAFGGVVLEVACGRKVLSMPKPPDVVVLVDWVWQRFSEGDLMSVVDSRLGDYDTQRMEMVLQVGLLCSHPDPLARPTMRYVVQMLAGDVLVPWIPSSKPVPAFSSRISQIEPRKDLTPTTSSSNWSSTSDSEKASEIPLFDDAI